MLNSPTCKNILQGVAARLRRWGSAERWAVYGKRAAYVPFIFTLALGVSIFFFEDIHAGPAQSPMIRSLSLFELSLFSKKPSMVAASEQTSPFYGGMQKRQVLVFLPSKDGLPDQPSLQKPVEKECFWWTPPSSRNVELQGHLAGGTALAHSFLRVGKGEWVPRYEAFSGQHLHLSAIRSALYFRGDTERMRLRAF